MKQEKMDREIVMPDDFTPEMRARHIADVMVDNAREYTSHEQLMRDLREYNGFDNLEVRDRSQAVALCVLMEKKPNRIGLMALENYLRESEV
ncbi:hypothetical protein AGMMS49942_03600 [Spirochaetia bacterium]|nr:hypothetical protein AGMMS49942_03600 [Spirochaetia bacterium]